MKGQTGGGKGGGANPSCHSPNPSITFLISLFLSPPVWLSAPLFSQNCISVSLQVKFPPVSSLSHSIISSIPSPSPPFLLLLPLFPLTICLSHQKHNITLPPPNSGYFPPASEEKVKKKIYKITIFRFMWPEKNIIMTVWRD